VEEKAMASGVATVWVPVDDMDRAVRFYTEVLGLTATSTMSDWSEIDAGGLTIGLNAREGTSAHADGGAVISFTPDSGIEQEVQRLEGAGVEFAGGISSYDWGRIAAFEDSEGNSLQIYGPPAD
jgi:predicted enzyme related to lactoylglutathione lyase